MKYSLFIGRYQSFHEGHKALIGKVLEEGKNVLIAVRDTPVDKNNPFGVEQRIEIINHFFRDEISKGRIKVISIPDIEEVCWGRKVGWIPREIRLDEEIELISGTKIREGRI